MRVLERLWTVIGFDSAIFVSTGRDRSQPAMVNKDGYAALYRKILKNMDRYLPSFEKGLQVAKLQGGVYIDTEIMGKTALDRLPFYQDVVRPQGIKSQLIAQVLFRGEESGKIFLCRHGRPRYRRADQDRLQVMMPSIGLAHVALHAIFAAGPPNLETSTRPFQSSLNERFGQLSPRELEIARFVADGLRNQDIARALGTSPNTVRNQLQQIYDKLGASGRTELAVWMREAQAPLENGAQPGLSMM